MCNSIAVPEKPKSWAALAASRAPSGQSNSAPATNSRPVRQTQQVSIMWRIVLWREAYLPHVGKRTFHFFVATK